MAAHDAVRLMRLTWHRINPPGPKQSAVFSPHDMIMIGRSLLGRVRVSPAYVAKPSLRVEVRSSYAIVHELGSGARTQWRPGDNMEVSGYWFSQEWISGVDTQAPQPARPAPWQSKREPQPRRPAVPSIRISSRAVMHFLLGVVVLIAALGGAYAVQQHGDALPCILSDSKAYENVRRESVGFTAGGYTTELGDVAFCLRQGQAKRVPLRLVTQRTYTVLAGCSTGCDHVQLSLYGDGDLLIRSPEQSDTIIVNGRPPQKSSYTLEVSMPGCTRWYCLAVVRSLSK